MTGKRLIGGVAVLVAIAALVWGFHALNLSRDQQIGFLGAAFGSFAAAGTALGVVEFQARREAGRARTVVDHLLFDAGVIAQDYLDTAGTEDKNQSALLLAFVGTMETALLVATDNQHRGIGMARAAHALRAMEPIIADVREEAMTGRMEVEEGTAELLAVMQSTMTDCRQILTTTSRRVR
jgi:hypothetical protein